MDYIVYSLQVSCVVLVLLELHLIVAQNTEGFFNKTSLVILETQLNTRGHTSFSFRTCSSGELLYQQGDKGDNIRFQLLDNATLLLEWTKDGVGGVFIHPKSNLANNMWHILDFRQERPLVLTLTIDSVKVVVSNVTYNKELQQLDLTSEYNPQLVIGAEFTGCLQEGLGVPLSQFSADIDVLWNQCPLEDRSGCDATIDHCFSQPCVHGICHSRPGGYVCECPTRYSGTNCDFDEGPLCARPENLCLNNGHCREVDSNYTTCLCIGRTTGARCETVIHDFCDPNPCHSAGICTENQYGDGYTCQCVEGFVGSNCEINRDECLLQPCGTGQCIDGINSYACNCTGSGYTGDNCEIDIDECAIENPCKHGSTCFNHPGSFLCSCVLGYYGPTCELEINECESLPCGNGGTCRDLLNSYSCTCAVGFTGTNCETNIDDCVDVTCPLNAGCIDLVDSYACACLPGYAGDPSNCVEVNECESEPCLHFGACTDRVNGYDCTCVTGFTGKQCEMNIDDCNPDSCLNGGTCLDDINQFSCICAPGFSGSDCSFDIDDCALNPCRNGGECQDRVNDYFCLCAAGWEGKNCSAEVNECLAAPCVNGGTCIDQHNGYICSCPPGFEGQQCERNIDDCFPNPCANQGTCLDGINDYTCICSPNWMGRHCTNVYNACSFTPCHNNGECATRPPSHDFNCTCILGFSGSRCETNIDDCQGIVCPMGQECVDGINKYTCACPDGFTGADCSIEVDECASGPCRNGGACTDLIGNYSCTCLPGFTGYQCESDIDECSFSPCVNGICHNTEGSFQCFCAQGWTSRLCDRNFDDCASRPCLNDGSCVDEVDDYSCICMPGYTGKQCGVDIDECASDPCLNGATCLDQINGYICTCVLGFAGSNCEINIDECASIPCQNNGQCLDLIAGYICNCSDTGFKGDNCEVNIDDCAPDPCVSGSTCIDLVKDFSCACYPGFTGKTCEIDIDECASNPCQYGGTCLQYSNETLYQMSYPGFVYPEYAYATAHGYLCECVPGIEGQDCEINIDECASNPCVNGRCLDQINSYECMCDRGYEGNLCDIDIDECEAFTPCSFATACTNLPGDYICHCVSKYGGKNCSVELIGCNNNFCQNGAMCVPYVTNEVNHNYTCTCLNGFYGHYCEIPTTASFADNVVSMITSASSSSYTISFRFRTTLLDGVVAWSINNFAGFNVRLMEGELYFTYQDIFNNKTVLKPAIPDTVSLVNGEWHNVDMSIQSFGFIIVSLTLNTLPVEIDVGVNATLQAETPLLDFPLTYFGGGFDTQYNNFTGCMQDIVVNDNWFIPEDYPHVQVGCNRVPQCDPDPCSGNGKCTDLWNTYSCLCDRPWTDYNCGIDFTPATFGYEGNVSYVEVSLTSTDIDQLRNEIDVSMFVRTTKPRGMIAYIGSQVSPDRRYDPEYRNEGQGFLIIDLVNGFLTVSAVLYDNNEQVFVVNRRVDDADYHFISVVHKRGILTITVDSETVTHTLSTTGTPPRMDHFYLGGFPVETRTKRQIEISAERFKGTMQDIRLNDQHVILYAHNMSNVDTATGVIRSSDPVSLSTMEVIHASNLVAGSPSDDLCANSPCLNDGTCSNKWNEYECACAGGYRGVVCAKIDYCYNTSCPEAAACQNLDDGHECVANATFDGKSMWISYEHTLPANFSRNVISLQYRTRISDATLLSIEGDDGRYIYCKIQNNELYYAWNLTGEPQGVNITVPSDGEWHQTKLNLTGSEIIIEIDDELSSKSIEEEFPPFGNILNKIFVGGPNPHLKGCLGEVRIGGILLPFFSDEEINSSASERFMASFPSQTPEFPCTGDPVCDTEPCANDGTCVDIWNDYNCSCSLGWEGFNCTENIDDCNEHECKNDATCIDGIANYTCNCPPGFTGDRCETDIDECESRPCQNNGTCEDEVDGFVCNCPEDYTGDLCEVQINRNCSSDPCENNATCIDVYDSNYNATVFNCICLPGYYGDVCEFTIDYCEEMPCVNGNCTSNTEYQNYTCTCTPGYEGVNCEYDIDECADQPCENGGTCEDLINDYICTCPPEWTGSNCEVDVDECALGNRTCTNNGTCINTPGSAYCDCPEYYGGDDCEIASDCLMEPCQNNGTCNPDYLNSTYTCNCTKGYTDQNCSTEIDWCEEEEIDCNMGNCTSVPSEGWVCHCPINFEGDKCQNRIPDCSDEPCENDGTCTNITDPYGYNCSCQPGYTGLNCEEDIDECDSNPCKNGGTCEDLINGYICTCPEGFTGINCEEDINECTSEPCLNGGTCSNTRGSFTCECADGFIGSVCEHNDPCNSTLCQNNGTCNSTIENDAPIFICDCLDGFEGQFCAEKQVAKGQTQIAVIVGVIAGVLFLIIVAVVVLFILMQARKKRATQGTYSPSRQEMGGSRVEMGTLMKPPPEERLI